MELSGNAPHQQISDVTVVVHDADGRVCHVHREITMEGADVPSSRELRARALDHAGRRLGDGAPKLFALELPTKATERYRGRPIRVDVERRRLAAARQPSRGRQSR